MPLLSWAPEIKTLSEKKLAGFRLQMSFANNKTYELWHRFMPLRSLIQNRATTDLISMQVYSPGTYSKDFTPDTEFEKWAAAEVADFNSIPGEMETYTLPAGMYAVFGYKGLPADFGPAFQYIFGTWLPGSGYVLDDRPHFEVLGARYNNNSPDSEEEIWVPVKVKE